MGLRTYANTCHTTRLEILGVWAVQDLTDLDNRVVSHKLCTSENCASVLN